MPKLWTNNWTWFEIQEAEFFKPETCLFSTVHPNSKAIFHSRLHKCIHPMVIHTHQTFWQPKNTKKYGKISKIPLKLTLHAKYQVIISKDKEVIGLQTWRQPDWKLPFITWLSVQETFFLHKRKTRCPNITKYLKFIRSKMWINYCNLLKAYFGNANMAAFEWMGC